MEGDSLDKDIITIDDKSYTVSAETFSKIKLLIALETETVSTELSSIQDGSIMMINDCPCEVTCISYAGPGRYSNKRKAHIVGKNIFNKNIHECLVVEGDRVKIPVIIKTRHTILEIIENDNSTCNIVDERGIAHKNVYIDKEMLHTIRLVFACGRMVDVTINKVFGLERIVSFKIAK